MKRSAYDILLIKYLLGEATPGECITAEEWISESSSNKMYYEGLKYIWLQSKQTAFQSSVNEEQAWQRFQQFVGKKPTLSFHNSPFYRRLPFLRVLAIVIFVAGSFWAIYSRFNHSQEKLPAIEKKESIVSPEEKIVVPKKDTTFNIQKSTLQNTDTLGFKNTLPTVKRKIKKFTNGPATGNYADSNNKNRLPISIEKGTIDTITMKNMMLDSFIRKMVQAGEVNYSFPPDTSALAKHQRENIVHNVVHDLLTEKVVTMAKDIESFKLTNTELIVNGKKQPTDVLLKFKTKYINKSGYGIYYGSEKLSGDGIYIEKIIL